LTQLPEDAEYGPEDVQMARLVLGLRSQGISDPAVLGAMERTPRQLFVPDLFLDRSFEDSALPISCGQTISQPLIVGRMTQALRLESRHRVLEIGTGSGYQSAILAQLCRLLYSVERYRTLKEEAEERFRQLDLKNIVTRFGDGGLGWPEQAPFDRIIVTCAAPDEPTVLLEQLKPGGILVVPVGKGPVQVLKRYHLKPEGHIDEESLGEVRFVPLLDGVAREL
jgi:protein-L-isoaspartate(D-aspartate) O-methyltransferase